MTYQLIDSGDCLKFEKFGEYSLIRPCPQALWRKKHPELWKDADATFSRETKNGWAYQRPLPKQWQSEIEGVCLKIAPTDFGHLGIFPEHSTLWRELCPLLREGDKVLNLFGYSGGATLAFAKAGAQVCHLDISKGMVDWARENASLNRLENAPIRWIVDDALKFLRREIKRGVQYDGILLDPPTFGQGSRGEVFKIEEDLWPLLELCKALLSENPRFVALSCHNPGISPFCLKQVVSQIFPDSKPYRTRLGCVNLEDRQSSPSSTDHSSAILMQYGPRHDSSNLSHSEALQNSQNLSGRGIESSEMILPTEGALSIPCGSYVKCIWKK